ncbi:deoxyribose-phosphate aldolase [Flavobacterium sp.]|jgi:deoxyribose-phosphate aldolase|uniref:deoxyribose-phosphate aldolase n=1 Tax=Flavobacterium sp. TaxID=239 RepID=UPI0037BEC35B
MDINNYLDSTYLKTAEQAGLDFEENKKIVTAFIDEAITNRFKLVMIRPDHVALAKEMIVQARSKLTIGTVIGFPEGTSSLADKLTEAQKAVDDGADDLDFVCNYRAFIDGDLETVKAEILQGTHLGLSHHKIVKWIIETAALTDKQIIQICSMIKNIVLTNFPEEMYQQVFVKSSTGFYRTENNLPNGATIPAIIMMLENASPLSVKAAGGVRTYDEAVEMIKLGVKRIGTSSAKAIASGQESGSHY